LKVVDSAQRRLMCAVASVPGSGVRAPASDCGRFWQGTGGFAIAAYAYITTEHGAASYAYLVDAIRCVSYGDPHGSDKLVVLSYAVLIATLIVNEVITMAWRVNRDSRLGRF
jgi:hypothetical protein